MNTRKITRKLATIFIVFIFISAYINIVYSYELQPNVQTNNIPKTASTINEDYNTIIILNSSRTIDVGKYGVINATDSLTFYNNGTNPIGYAYYCINSNFEQKLLYISAQSGFGPSLSIQLSNYRIMDNLTYMIFFNQPLLPGSSINVSVNAVYANLITISGSYTSETNVFTLNLVPFSPYTIVSDLTSIIIPKGTTSNQYSPQSSSVSGTVKSYTRSNINGFTNENITVSYTDTKYSILVMKSLTREIDVNPWGYIKVTEQQVIQNIGLITVTDYNYTITGDVKNITVTDPIGTLSGVDVDNVTNPDGLTRNVTMDLTSNRSPLRPNSTASFTVAYILPINNYLKSGLESSGFKINLYNLFQAHMLIMYEKNVIYLYAGNKITSNSIDPNSINFGKNSLILTYTDSNVVPMAAKYLYVVYTMNYFQIFWRGILFSLITMALLSAYVVFRKRSRKGKEVEEEFIESIVPEKEIREFITLYEEMNAVRIDIRQLDESLSKKKIAKKLYAKQKKTLESKLKETQEEIKPFKKTLLNTGGRFTEIVQKLDLKEAEFLSNEDSIKLHDDRYKRGKLPSKQAYNTLKAQMLKNSEKIQREIDKSINELKAFLI